MSNNEMVSVPRELVQRMIDCAEAYVDIDDADLIELRALLAAPEQVDEAGDWMTPTTKPVPPAGGGPDTLAWIDRSLDQGVILTLSGHKSSLDNVGLVDRAHVIRLQAEVEKFKAANAELSASNVRRRDREVAARKELDALKAKPQDEPVPLTAVGVLRDDGDGGLVPEWILEGGTAELWDGATLLIADVDPDLCVDDGHCELYRVPPAPVAVVLPERLSYPMQEDYDDVEEFLEAWSKASAHNACLDEVARLNSL